MLRAAPSAVWTTTRSSASRWNIGTTEAVRSSFRLSARASSAFARERVCAVVV